MKLQKWILFFVALALIGGTAVLLPQLQARQKPGKPGVRLVMQPVFDEDGKVARTNSVGLPTTALDYQSQPLPITKIELTALPPDTIFGRRQYRAQDGFETAVSVVVMGTDRTSIHKAQICLPAQGWSIERTDMLPVSVTEPQPYELPVTRLIIVKKIKQADGREVNVRAVYVYWFVSENKITAGHGIRMWELAWDLFRTGVLQRWAYVTCLSTCEPGAEEKVFERMKQLIAASVPQFQLVPGATNGVSAAITAGK